MELINGDCTDRKIIKKESVNVTVTSPPYNIGMEYESYKDEVQYEQYLKFTEEWAGNVFYWTKNNGRLLVNIALDKTKGGKVPLSFDVCKAVERAGWKYWGTIVWDKIQGNAGSAWGSWKQATAPSLIQSAEVILVMYKDEWKRTGGTSTITAKEFAEYIRAIWRFPGAKKNFHVAPFPRELPKRCIKLFSFEEDIVLDPFMGSGTTGLECIQNKRSFIGIEKSTEYFKKAKKRLELAGRQTDLEEF